MDSLMNQRMQMSLESDKRSKRINLAEFATFSNNFILEANTVSTKKVKQKAKDDKEQEKSAPEKNSINYINGKSKLIGNRWNFGNIEEKPSTDHSGDNSRQKHFGNRLSFDNSAEKSIEKNGVNRDSRPKHIDNWSFESVADKLFPEQKDNNSGYKSKHIGIRWNFDNGTVPNWTSLKYPRRVSHLQRELEREREPLRREDTFDADFMMPTRVREVLEAEGLEKQVINSTIGKSEQKHKEVIKKMTDRGNIPEKIEIPAMNTFKPIQTTTTSPRQVGGATVITTQASPKLPGASNISPLSWLNLRKEDPPLGSLEAKWENPFSEHRKKQYDHINWNQEKATRSFRDDLQPEQDKRRWESAQHAEILYSGPQFNPPRIVLVSSKIPKCHLLTRVYKENVIPIIYDFETWTFTDIIENVTRKLEVYRRRCKAKSIMVLCQGGPGFIYLLRNCAITPQKLTKPTYRGVIDFWRCLGDLVSKIKPREAAIHLVGFNLVENEQGRRLLPMLQSFMYPNLVAVSNPYEDSEEGEAVLAQYFNMEWYRIWKMHQNTSANEIDYIAEERSQAKAKGQGRQTIQLQLT